MNRIAILVTGALILSTSAFAARVWSPAYYCWFQSYGEDCYADGSPVLSGECYALIWRCNEWANKTDGLLKADGTPVDPDKCDVVWIFPVAVCDESDPTYPFSWMEEPACCSISSLYLKNRDSKGVYSFLLLDTRIWNGNGWSVGGKATDYTVKALNGYGFVPGLESIDVGRGIYGYDDRGGTKSPPESTSENTNISDWQIGFCMTEMTPLMPDDCPKPCICDIAVSGGIATLSVTNTAPYLAYDISMTSDLAKVHSTTNFVGDIKQGVGAEPLTWTIPVGAEKQGFFKVLPRKPDFSK